MQASTNGDKDSRSPSGQLKDAITRLGISNRIVSYEDLIMAQFAEQARMKGGLNWDRSEDSSRHENEKSYASRPPKPSRPFSATLPSRPVSAKYKSVTQNVKPRISAQFIADPNLWDPESLHGDGDHASEQEHSRPRHVRSRPRSSPTVRNRERASSLPGREECLRGKPNRRVPVYKRQPQLIRCIAYRNGSRDVCMHVAIPTVKQLLEMCTNKLSLGGAARRIFLVDGTEVFQTEDIDRDAEIYVSAGEPFRDPYAPIKKTTEQKKELRWTMEGLVLPEENKKKKKRFLLSKRFKSQIEVKNRRVLVFKNGAFVNGVEIITDMQSVEDFLSACTSRLELRGHARTAYDWEGNEVTDFSQIPELDSCLQSPGCTPVLGPVWVAAGAGFSPQGARSFLEELIVQARNKMKSIEYQQKELQFCVQGQKEKVQTAAVLSLTGIELEEGLQQTSADIDALTEAIAKLRDQADKLASAADEEKAKGYAYTLQHIEQIEMDDTRVGGVGLKLTVYMNGSYDNCAVVYFNIRHARRGVGSENKEMIMERLLDQCATRLSNAASQGTKFARKLYNRHGNIIANASELKDDQPLWLSYGEPFKLPYVSCLQVTFDKARGLVLEDGRSVVLREGAMTDDPSGYKSGWDASIGLPVDYNCLAVENLTIPGEKDAVLESLSKNQVDIKGHYLQSKDKKDILLFPEVCIAPKRKKSSSDLWPSDAQMWVISKSGFIFSKPMPCLVLAVVESLPVSCHLLTKNASGVRGFAVGLQKRQEGNPAQHWRFTADGFVFAASHPDLVLTDLGSSSGADGEEVVNNEAEGILPGHKFYLAVCEKLMGKDRKHHRFALKQGRFENFGQWKKNDRNVVTNFEFNKLAYSWPVDETGAWNENFDWPMEGCLVSCAPPVRRPGSKGPPSNIPLRLMVRKNGETDTSRAMAIVGPDLTNMMKDLSKTVHEGGASPRAGAHGRKSPSSSEHNDQSDSIADLTQLHCEDMTLRDLEFLLFLDRCTSLMGLPIAARRVFDEHGSEHTSLAELERDQLVFVSCGEPWADLKLTKEEQQRRLVLANLASDVLQMNQYCTLRDTEGYVLEVERSTTAGAKVFLNYSNEKKSIHRSIEEHASDIGRRQATNHRANPDEDSHQQVAEPDMLFSQSSTAHERAHTKAEEQHDRMKWPWERIMNEDVQDLMDSGGGNVSPDRSSSPERHRPRLPRDSSGNLQQFSYENGFIVCCANDGLVLSAVESDSHVLEIALAKKNSDDLMQRWIIRDNGLIQAKHGGDRVLTVSVSTALRRSAGDVSVGYVGCHVSLQRRATTQFGHAHQLWHYDVKTGRVHAFWASRMDAEITAANKANVCTYAVTKEELDQPGYTVVLPTKKSKPEEVIICTSCARAMRGRYKLVKLAKNVDFACTMGDARAKGIQPIGSFRCLNGKVDLSTYEALNTIEFWEGQYHKLKEEQNIRTITKEISASKAPVTVKVYVYRNGEGRRKDGQTVIGTSIVGILDQSTYRLGMTSAARRLYAADGTLLLSVDDIVRWAVENYERRWAGTQAYEGEEAQCIGGQEKNIGTEASNVERASGTSSLAGSSDGSTTEYHLIEKLTDRNEEGYMYANVEPFMCDHLIFQVKAAQNAQLALIEHGQQGSVIRCEVKLGSSTNSESAIVCKRHLEDSSPRVVQLPTPQILSGGESRSFWVTWRNGNFVFGKGSTVGQLTVAECPGETKSINYAAVATTGSAKGIWQLHVPLARPSQNGSITSNNSSGPVEIKKLISVIKLDAEESTDAVTQSQNGILNGGGDAAATTNKSDQALAQPKGPPEGGLAGNGDQQPANKLSPIAPPSIETILRYPIEAWASAGEAFVNPQQVDEADSRATSHYRDQVAAVSYELQMEKHRLRQMQGRRYDELSPGKYEPTSNPSKPVVLRSSWQEPTSGEVQSHDRLHKLQNKLMEAKATVSRETGHPLALRRLYQQPDMKRVLAFPNGESLTRAVYVWGESIEQLLDNAASRLSLRKKAKVLFNLDGTPVKQFDDICRDQLVSVAVTDQFLTPKDATQTLEISANWARARKQYGNAATDIVVTSKANPRVNVDPFGPPNMVVAEKSFKTKFPSTRS